MFPVRLLLVLLFQGVLFSTQCVAQFNQDTTTQGNRDFWQPDSSLPNMEVIDFQPTIITLEYNCQYLPSICQNVENYRRRKKPLPKTTSQYFIYDMNSKRKSKRRDNVCPTKAWRKVLNAKGKLRCPETAPAQPDFYRADKKVWLNKELKPGVVAGQKLAIGDYTDLLTNQTTKSGIYYSCDEFPAAAWVQGGAGLGANAFPASTYCAPMSCTIAKIPGSRSEQNWQGAIHKSLRNVINAVGTRLNTPGFINNTTPSKFYFRTVKKPNNVAAQVYVNSLTGDDFEKIQGLTKRFAGIADMDVEEREALIVRTIEEDPDAFFKDAWSLKTFAVDWEGEVHPDDLKMQSSYIVSRALGSAGTDHYRYIAEPGSALYSPKFQNTNVSDDSQLALELDMGIGSRAAMVPGPSRDSEETPKAKNTIKFTTLLQNATEQEIAKAETLVDDAIKESDKRVRARMDHMARNHYTLKPKTKSFGSSAANSFAVTQDDTDMPPPFLEITDELQAAAALVAELDAQKANMTRIPKHLRLHKRDSSFWMANIQRQGTVPFGNDASYKVFRNVMDYGAKADGVTDDSQAFRDAINDGRRCGKNCNGATTKNAIIYVPAGTYAIASTVPVVFGTQLIGDATNWPTLKAASRVLGKGLLSTDEYTGGGLGPDGLDKEWYINTANFYRQIRNFKLDLSNTRNVDGVSGIHYQIAQATSLQFIEITLRSEQTGIFSENGSGGLISDISIKGGKYGFYGGNQQFTAMRLTFDGCTTAVRVIWDWGWVWKSVTVKNAKVGFQLVALTKGGGNNNGTRRSTSTLTDRDLDRGKAGSIGSASFLDSSFSNVDNAIVTKPFSSETAKGSTGVVIQNCKADNVKAIVADTDGKTLVEKMPDVSTAVAIGPVYRNDGTRKSEVGEVFASYAYNDKTKASSGLQAQDNVYFERPKPQYEKLSADDFMSVKSRGVKGDGVTDDTMLLEQAIINATVAGKVAFIDAGSYIITKTITIPNGAIIVGETWSQLVAHGDYFSVAANPKVMVRVGEVGDVGSVEMQDLLFTSKGPTPGAILVEWNIKASEQGSAALWDCHARLGGATGTELTPDECPPLTNGLASNKCQAASLMMHLTAQASGYFENMWLWVADHMIDDPKLDDPDNDMVQTTIYAARGFLIESQAPTWLYGTASEHSVMYQYNFHKAANVFAAMIQTESPYYQPNPTPPAPFEKAVGIFESDPDYSCNKMASDADFNGCDESKYSQDCIDTQKCQMALALINDNYADIKLYHFISIGAKYMAVVNGKGIEAKDNLNFNAHPYWSQVSVLEIKGGDGDPDSVDDGDGDVWVNDSIWGLESNHTVSCYPPCTFHLPGWTSGPSTVYTYPPIDYTESGIVKTTKGDDITVTYWDMEPITVPHPAARTSTTTTTTTTSGAAVIIGIYTPKRATTTTWPVIIVDQSTTLRPTQTHPGPPPPGPPPGSIPGLTVVIGHPPGPTALPCLFPDLSCPSDKPPDNDDDGEQQEEDPDKPGFCFDGPDSDFPMGSQCTGNDGCPSCGDDAAARCERGWCGCLDYLSPGEAPPDSSDGGSVAARSCHGGGDGGGDSYCSHAYACKKDGDAAICGNDGFCTCPNKCPDGSDPVCQGAACECPAPPGPVCTDPYQDCEKMDCDNAAGLYGACVDGRCLCARGLFFYIDYRAGGFQEVIYFDLKYNSYPELNFHSNQTVGGSPYSMSYDGPDGSHVDWDWCQTMPKSNIHYTHKSEDYKFHGSDSRNIGNGCPDPTGTSFCTRRHGFWPLTWLGRNPKRTYNIIT